VKTINLSIPEDVWKQARIEAAKRNTSLSALVRGYLKAMVQGKAPVITEEATEDSDKQSREALLHALQSSHLVLGFEPSRSRTYER
jgi:plasmid stability protein